MRIITLSFFLLHFLSFSQDYGIGYWQTHFPINKGVGVTQSKNEVFFASAFGVVKLDKETQEKSKITKSEGLMSNDISCVIYDDETEELIIGYESGGIDIYNQGSIISLFDIVRSNIIGSKRINSIKKYNNLFYLCTDFGVVVFDNNKKEIKDTYYIGPNGDNQVFDITFFNDFLFTATSNGLYKGQKGSLLSNNTNWKQETLLPYPNANYEHVFVFANTLYTNLNNGQYFSDTLYSYNGLLWEKEEELTARRNKSFYVKGDSLYVANDYGITILDKNLSVVNYIYEYSPTVGAEPQDISIDFSDSETIWCADKKLGLVKNKNTWFTTFFNYNTPVSTNVNKMDVSESLLWMAYGGASGSKWHNVWLQDGIAYYDGVNWITISKYNENKLDSIFDLIDLAVDPKNKNHVFAASLGDGILEFSNNKLIQQYSVENSSLQLVEPATSNWYWIGVSAVNFDYTGNLWAANYGANKILSVLDLDSTWHSIDARQYTSSQLTGDFVANSKGQIWLYFLNSQGILIHNSNGSFDDISDDKGVMLTQTQGLPSNTVFCLAEDVTGQMWIGTDKGIAVVYDTDNVFEEGGLIAQKILIEQDGYTEYLLENNTVTSIAVDGANRKWIGTRSAGVFLVSEDGKTEILHFTNDNSPLPSNEIKTIAINQTTGEVFFGTDQGIVSYRAEATFGQRYYDNNVKVFPNPVREDYYGPIAIKGLAANSEVKITDISGTLVFETKALGGQAVWYGTDINGERASSGVYLVFSVNSDGTESMVTKILFIN